MTNRIENLEQILTSMNICDSAKTTILEMFGNRPKVTKANLRKALKYKGAEWFMGFVQRWMGMDYEFRKWIIDQRDSRIWNRRHRDEKFLLRVKAADNIVLEAVYAYYQEWRKP